MRKRIFSIFLAVAMIFCIIPLSAYADEHQHTFENKHGYDLSNLPEGYSIPCKIYESPCSSECGYSLYSWDVFGLSGQFVDKTGTSGLVVYQHYREWFEKIYGRNATASKYQTGGGSAGTGGVGRRPSGYSENNKPDVSNTGLLHFYAPVTGWTRSIYSVSKCAFWTSDRITDIEVPSANASGTVFPSSVSSGSYVMAVCAFTAPVSGTYSTLPGNVIGKYRYVRSNKWYINEYISSSATGSYAKGDSAWLVAWASAACSTYAYDAEGYGVDIYAAPRII